MGGLRALMGAEGIVRFITATGYEQIPSPVIGAAKRCLIDTIGVALAGSCEPEGRIIAEFCTRSPGPAAASILGRGVKTSEMGAALANGTMAHALDYDDISLQSLGHPSAVLVPVVLALAERDQLTGREVLAAYVVGYEIATRFGQAMGIPFFESNWHATPVIGSIAAAAAGAKILRLTALQTRMGLGIASSLAGGLKQNFGTMTKPLHAGRAAENGILAALLAGRGFTANPAILENENGFCAAFAKDYEREKLGEQFGEKWNLLAGAILKAYPCCAGSHGCVDAVLHLKGKYSFSAEDIEEVECRISPTVGRTTICPRPRTVQESRFSLEYAVAMALLDGEVSLRQFHLNKLTSPSTAEMMSRIRCLYLEEDLGHGVGLPQEVVIRLKNGQVHARRVGDFKGTSGNPLTDEEVFSKFADCAGFVLGTGEIEKAVEFMMNFETLQDLSPFMKVVSPAKEG